MAEEKEPTQDIEISNPVLGKLAAHGVRTSDIIGLLTFCGVLGIGFVGWQTSEAVGAHKVETAQSNAALTGAIRDLSESQRLMTCVISVPQDRREREFTEQGSFCRRMAGFR